jgi:hypothetical protein
MASSTLNTAILARVGEKNRKTSFPNLKLYMLSPREIVDTMRAKHGVATSDDVSKLRDPMSRALTPLSDLTDHMNSFLLTSQCLTRSSQGETDYKYFEFIIETVSGFPLCRPVWPNTTRTSPLQQSLVTLFPFREKLKDHLDRGDPSSPFSRAAKALQQSNVPLPATASLGPAPTTALSSSRLLHPRTVPVTPTPKTTKNPVGDLRARSPYRPPLPAPTRLK